MIDPTEEALHTAVEKSGAAQSVRPRILSPAMELNVVPTPVTTPPPQKSPYKDETLPYLQCALRFDWGRSPAKQIIDSLRLQQCCTGWHSSRPCCF